VSIANLIAAAENACDEKSRKAPAIVWATGADRSGTGALGALKTRPGSAFMAALAREHLRLTRWGLGECSIPDLL
jgi:hypothetical protein